MDVGVYKIDEITNDFIIDKIKAHESFVLECGERERYLKTLSWLEKEIEDQGLKVRVYLRARSLSLSGIAGVGVAAPALMPVAVGAVAVGLAAGAGIAVHRLATFNPDYEIGKNPWGQALHVDYKK